MLGLPPQSGDLFRRWIHEFLELGITDQNAMERAAAEIRAFFAAEIAERRKMPRDDLISYLVRRASTGGSSMTSISPTHFGCCWSPASTRPGASSAVACGISPITQTTANGWLPSRR
jgi:hypothetical protein